MRPVGNYFEHVIIREENTEKFTLPYLDTKKLWLSYSMHPELGAEDDVIMELKKALGCPFEQVAMLQDSRYFAEYANSTEAGDEADGIDETEMAEEAQEVEKAGVYEDGEDQDQEDEDTSSILRYKVDDWWKFMGPRVHEWHITFERPVLPFWIQAEEES